MMNANFKYNNSNEPARAWYEHVNIPTYQIGQAEKNPIFLEKRVYQGSSGSVYPYPVIEKITDQKTDQIYQAIFLENKYLKVMVLPELGGRIQMAFDKLKNRHFIYYNQVIKPALVGLTGPWISGGIEFNWPQHHRPTTFDPVDHFIEKNKDGSVTVWCSEVERMFRTKGMAGFTLHPDKAYLEIKVRLFNRSEYPQTFLWWANPAVRVNDYYHSVFPPDVHAVFDHGKRDTSSFPIARGIYYKVDYAPGTDISRYKNIPVPTSYMAIASKYDFVGGYEEDSQAGLLHVANHHISPGKKQWTWGNGAFGKAWDRHLTDEDGPYIELMCGVYTDNQPDFAWLMPGEEKAFSQYFMPYRDLGMVKNATVDAMVNLEVSGQHIRIRAFTTAEQAGARIVLMHEDQTLYNDTFDFHPGTSFDTEIQAPAGTNPGHLSVMILSTEGKCLVAWQSGAEPEREMPEAAKAIDPPQDIADNEGLYLAGLHLEQYRHATYDPRDYYNEALRRNPGDIRCNNSMGLWHLRRGQFKDAEKYFRTAQETLTTHNPNPIDGEPCYNLGMSLLFQDKTDEAYDAFFKSVWNAAQLAAGYFQIARIEAKRGQWEEALKSVEWSLAHNMRNHKARHLKALILRKTGYFTLAKSFVLESLETDRFNFPLYLEWHMLDQHAGALDQMTHIMRGNIHNYMEYALDYAYAGCYGDALQFLEAGIKQQQSGKVYALALYYKAWFEQQAGDSKKAGITLQQAALAAPDYCFPNQPEALKILQWASSTNASDAKAHYYIGNLLYGGRMHNQAALHWETSAGIDDSFPTVHRNLALYLYNKKRAPEPALLSLEKAFGLNNGDARVLMELDQLYKKLNHPVQKRLDLLEKYPSLVLERDDLYLERVNLYNICGQHDKALKLIQARNFHPWEGGEGKVIAQYIWCLIALARKAAAANDYGEALRLTSMASAYPENLGEERLFTETDSELNYWLGIANKECGNKILAQSYFEKASQGLDEPSMAMYYNDLQPDAIYYQGKALEDSGNTAASHERFRKLIDYGMCHMNDHIRIDYFAVSLPDLLIWEEDLDMRNRQLCNYLIGLGQSGLGQYDKAALSFKTVLDINNTHEGTTRHLQLYPHATPAAITERT